MNKRGIDISEWQGKIDFQKVKNAGIDCVIVRYADGSYIDKNFAFNMGECERKGLHFGAYIFSRAVNEAQAREEAQAIIKACSLYKYDMPLYIDMEASNLSGIANKIINAFLDECDKAGVKGGIYANLNWFNNYINTRYYVDRPLWIAQYNDYLTHSNPAWFGMWQYTSKGSCPGINGNVDLNYVYIEYWNNKKEEPKESSAADEIKIKAVDVILGKYGTGSERKKKLGSSYEAVQEVVNELIERIKG